MESLQTVIRALGLYRIDLVFFELLSDRFSERNLILMTRDFMGNESVWKIAPIQSLLLNEILCLSQIPPHPNLISLKSFWINEGYLYLEFERAKGQCLVDLLVEKGSLSEDQTKEILRQLMNAVNFLHSVNWVHRDIKPDNMIWDGESQNAEAHRF
eukprot:TRINITY_DN617_c0_g1_i1.p1 TRINITY_DN617_c0_g1~~TRINITY_DN617_c0_g1_i1.p1  ORF type:complete len:164 (+),score=27.68 TRINITY_DN617_c0_g1_i1:25-492(+)